MQTTFYIELKFCIEDLEVRYYKNHVNKNEV